MGDIKDKIQYEMDRYQETVKEALKDGITISAVNIRGFAISEALLEVLLEDKIIDKDKFDHAYWRHSVEMAKKGVASVKAQRQNRKLILPPKA